MTADDNTRSNGNDTIGGDCNGTMIELPAVETHPGDHPCFDVGVMVDTEARQGRLDVTISLSGEECEAIFEESGGGHEYPDDVRERVLRALELDGVD